MSQIGNKQIMAENIQRLMDARGKDRMSVCADLGFKYSTFSEWVTGIKYPRIDKIEIMADYFGVSKSDLIEKYNPEKNSIPPGFDPLPRTVRIPLVGSIACGEPITAEENIEDYVDAPAESRPDFALRCKGDSMIEAGIEDGDIVYIKKAPEVRNGEIAAVRIGDEATLKYVYWDRNVLSLVPANKGMSPLIYAGEALEDVHIEGKAVGFTHWFK